MEKLHVLSHKQFSAELSYQAAMSIARTLLKRGLINQEQYSLIDTRFAQKYQPFFSRLIKG